MIQEIINFVKELEEDYPEVFDLNKKPSPGLHFWVELDEEGHWKNNQPKEGTDYVVYDGKEGLSEKLKEALKYQEAQDYLTMNKQKKFDGKQKIHSASPFAVSFNFSLGTVGDEKLEGWGIKKKPTKEEYTENFERIINVKKGLVDESISNYFKNSRKIIIPEEEEALYFISEKFEQSYSEILDVILALKTSEGVKLLSTFKEKDYVRIYLSNVDIEKQKELHEAYVSDNIYNKDVYNLEAENTTFGVADFMTTFASKKIFLSHKTSFFKKEINVRIKSNDALRLSKFLELQNNKVLPNPLPIFIDKNEFKNNKEIVSVFNNEGERKFKYPQLLKAIFNKNDNRILGNYYLLNMSRGVVNDFDFVSNFHYNVKGFDIKNILQFSKKKELVKTIPIHNVFGFENTIVVKIFNNSLVKVKDDSISYNYFNDIDPNYVSGGDLMANTILRFRKAFYDFIYKSQNQAITSTMFDEIMLASIFCDLRQDEYKDGYHTKENNIKEKLNIWFSLYNKFSNQSKNRENMENSFKSLLERIELIANNDDQFLDENNVGEFLFAAGQVIYFLLSKSKASNPSHALLEPYLQKSNAVQLQNAIANAINAYKHEISFYKDRFERLAGQILAFQTKENLKNYQRYLLAGYFAPAVMYKKAENVELNEVSHN